MEVTGLWASLVSQAYFPAWQTPGNRYNTAQGIVKYVQPLVIGQGNVLAPKQSSGGWPWKEDVLMEKVNLELGIQLSLEFLLT